MADSILRLSLLIIGLVVLGSIACLPLYKWKLGDFVRSSLFLKISMWLPIYGIILISLYTGPLGGTVLAIILAGGGLFEFIRQARLKKVPLFGYFYIIWFLVCIAAMIALFWKLKPEEYIAVALLIYFSSVLSDVFAFFLGSYIKKPSLPSFINSNKSWFGVLGQLIGGIIGVWVGSMLITSASMVLWFGILIGIASAVGDIINSLAKRQIGIKDWGATIPGHGGILDRCSSLVVAFLSVWIVLWFTF